MQIADRPPLLRRLQDGIQARFYQWRDGLVANARFQRWAAAFPFTRPVASAQSRKLFDLCAGFVYSQVLLACTELDIFRILAKGPRTAQSLAAEIALPVEATERLLRAATALELCCIRTSAKAAGTQQTAYGLGMLGAALLGNPGVVSMIRHHRLFYHDLADPVALLRGDIGADGTALSRFWPYARDGKTGLGTTESSAASLRYSELMSASQSLVVDDILEVYPFNRHRVVMDVGGGDGTFLLNVAHHCPQTQLMLFDLPGVAVQAAARFADAGLAGRATAFGGDASTGALPTGADLITLVRVLHDHDDAKAAAILAAVFHALPPGGTVLIAEPMAGVRGAEPMGDAYFGFYLLAMGSGRPRTEGEMLQLLRQAGFDDVQFLKTRRPLMTSAIQARRAAFPTSQSAAGKVSS